MENGAMDLPESDFRQKFGFSKPSKDAPIVTHCLKGGRAGKSAEFLTQNGYTNVK